ncbi:hypothetical protein KSS87_011139 [Heliosperma pusillum]|nr:hypothetical protein KSS87_011139 [Heliosperma pusillum]
MLGLFTYPLGSGGHDLDVDPDLDPVVTPRTFSSQIEFYLATPCATNCSLRIRKWRHILTKQPNCVPMRLGFALVFSFGGEIVRVEVKAIRYSDLAETERALVLERFRHASFNWRQSSFQSGVGSNSTEENPYGSYGIVINMIVGTEVVILRCTEESSKLLAADMPKQAS